jgi:hypothetical protein
VVLAIALLAACGSRSEPEEELRALVDEAEVAAEERDASALRALIADDYQDPRGRNAGDVRAYLHGYLIAHPSIRLITRIDSIELEGKELARVAVTVGMLGREAGADDDWDLAGDIYRLDLRLAREDDGDWRVIRAATQDEN